MHCLDTGLVYGLPHYRIKLLPNIVRVQRIVIFFKDCKQSREEIELIIHFSGEEFSVTYLIIEAISV